MKFRVHKTRKGWQWVLLSQNKSIVASGPTYRYKYDAVRGAKRFESRLIDTIEIES